MARRKLEVVVTGDAKSLNRALGQAQGNLTRFGRQFEANNRKFQSSSLFSGKGLAAAAGLGASFAFLRDGVQVASNLNEQISKSNVVFGSSADEIQRWARTASSSVLLAEDKAVEAAAAFGGLLRPLGLSGEKAAEMSRELVQLSADLASFNNSSPEEALLALRSALVGEVEPLRRFGAEVSAARVAQEAMRQTGKKSAQELTQQEKVLARYTLIMRDTRFAQGDVARTSDSLANQTRQLSANWRELQGRLAQGVVPVLAKTAGWTNDLLESFEGVSLSMDQVIDRAEQIVDTFGLAGLEIVKLAQRVRDAEAIMAPGETARQGGITGGGGGAATAAAPTLRTQIPNRLRQQLLDAQIKGDTGGVLAALGAQRRFLERALGQKGLKPGDVTDLKEDLLSVTDAIRSIHEQQAAAAERMRSEAERAREDAKRKADDARRKQRDALEASRKALAEWADAMKARAQEIKQGLLGRLDALQQKRDVNRAVFDAHEGLRIARQLGGPATIREATRELQDARLAQTRFRLEQAAPQAVASAVVHVHGVESPEEVARRVVAILNRNTKSNATQMRGRGPGFRPF